MAKITDDSYPLITTPDLADILVGVSASAVGRITVSNLLKAVYPIGSIYCTTDNTNPATTFGFGTWEVYAAGRVLVGIDSTDADFDTVGETIGAKTHTLTTAEMPAHTHNFLPRSATTGAVSSIVTGTLDTSSTISGSNQPHIQSTGGGGAHNNIQPSVVVCMFRRTA